MQTLPPLVLPLFHHLFLFLSSSFFILFDSTSVTSLTCLRIGNQTAKAVNQMQFSNNQPTVNMFKFSLLCSLSFCLSFLVVLSLCHTHIYTHSMADLNISRRGWKVNRNRSNSKSGWRAQLRQPRHPPSIPPVTASSYNTGTQKKEKVERLASNLPVELYGVNMLQLYETATLKRCQTPHTLASILDIEGVWTKGCLSLVDFDTVQLSGMRCFFVYLHCATCVIFIKIKKGDVICFIET